MRDQRTVAKAKGRTDISRYAYISSLQIPGSSVPAERLASGSRELYAGGLKSTTRDFGGSLIRPR
jgi:hypothetical protein